MEGDKWVNSEGEQKEVSIHASRMEGDQPGRDKNTPSAGFNPRLPDGGRPGDDITRKHTIEFQSTPPGWRATHLERRNMAILTVSIHASRMEGDYPALYKLIPQVTFQSTPPGWRATTGRCPFCGDGEVSIHASRMEGDDQHVWAGRPSGCFNPRLPDGGRQHVGLLPCAYALFQSTPPGWRATRMMAAVMMPWMFQSTPPGWRATHCGVSSFRPCWFQSTPPGWRAT